MANPCIPRNIDSSRCIIIIWSDFLIFDLYRWFELMRCQKYMNTVQYYNVWCTLLLQYLLYAFFFRACQLYNSSCTNSRDYDTNNNIMSEYLL